MTTQSLERAARRATKSGNWIIRTENGDVTCKGFRWPSELGVWVTAPDWDPTPVCGGGLHGQGPEAGGYKHDGSRVIFCETRGPRVIVDGDKVKVREARRLVIGRLPAGLILKAGARLNLTWTQVAAIPAGLILEAGATLNLSGTQVAAIPAGLILKAGAELYLGWTPLGRDPNRPAMRGIWY